VRDDEDTDEGHESSSVEESKDPIAEAVPIEEDEVEEAKERTATTLFFTESGSVSVTVSSKEQWLCVGRLPRTFTNDEFLQLVEEYGPVDETHMIHSDKTGRINQRLLT
jgi:hypothetical protein